MHCGIQRIDSPVEGRIIKLLKLYGNTESSYKCSVSVRWYTVSHDGITQPFTANWMPPGTLVNGNSYKAFGRAPADATDRDPGDAISDRGRFGAIGLKPDYFFPRGALSIWKTVKP